MELVEETCVIDEIPLNYVRRGRGPNHILLCPNALGTWDTDYSSLIPLFDATKFTVIAWAPPGYGKSVPANRKFNIESHRKDALTALKLMKQLKLHPYTVVGWGEGGRCALHMAASSGQSTVKKCVIWSTWVNIQLKTVEFYDKIRDVEKWPEDMRKKMAETYGGTKELQTLWTRNCNFIKRTYERRTNGNICRDVLPYVKQPVLLLHGCNGTIPLYYNESVEKEIARAKLVKKEGVGQDIHQKDPKWLMEQIQSFILNEWTEKPKFPPKHIDPNLMFR